MPQGESFGLRSGYPVGGNVRLSAGPDAESDRERSDIDQGLAVADRQPLHQARRARSSPAPHRWQSRNFWSAISAAVFSAAISRIKRSRRLRPGDWIAKGVQEVEKWLHLTNLLHLSASALLRRKRHAADGLKVGVGLRRACAARPRNFSELNFDVTVAGRLKSRPFDGDARRRKHAVVMMRDALSRCAGSAGFSLQKRIDLSENPTPFGNSNPKRHR